MEYSWELFILVCAYITVFGSQKVYVHADDEQHSSESSSPKPPSVPDTMESTTEPAKKKIAISELKNNNMLRDKNAHSYVTENVKSLLDDAMKSSVLSRPDLATENSEPEQVPTLVAESSDVDHGRRAQSNVFGFVPRNVRDLIPNLDGISNSTDITISNSSVAVLKENITSLTNASSDENKTSSIFQPNVTSNRTTNVTNRIDTASSTSIPQSPKIRDKAKPKPDTNPKQFKKPSINFKNKPYVITNINVSVEAMKPENMTEYSTDEPINDNLTTDNTSGAVWINGTSKHNGGNKTVSSLLTSPESESWAPLTVILIGLGVVALISVVTAIGMLSVTLYRRYHWNKPQTFSDKCSNADSTGYIDDSTLKENSEEMYSLDNDSFLNSLEAMTIQNYWADSIRHTKL